ncbi:MAG: photosystem II biogenesis protein Psp29 [Coleofasciculaceae cyanobacterium SM2_3_26]|nr:photosystem II biogenesis protein Psp29 [Coleofasciculaceae cyanobacterium SM2_3_26]
MENVRTVSETKKAFYQHHARPINSIYRQFVEEMMVEMHLLSVNQTFRYDPIYALGVVTAFEQFMQGYKPEADCDSIFNALCRATGQDPETYRNDANRLKNAVEILSPTEAVEWLRQRQIPANVDGLQATLQAIAHNPTFKYSRLFGIGLYALLQTIDAKLVNDASQQKETLVPICEALHLPQEKIQKDWELYRSNLEKMTQALTVMADILETERKKRLEREREKEKVTAQPSNTGEGSSSDS